MSVGSVRGDVWRGWGCNVSVIVQEIRNTVGNIPLEWYEDYPHLGYDLDGKKITKPHKRDEVSRWSINQAVLRGCSVLFCL